MLQIVWSDEARCDLRILMYRVDAGLLNVLRVLHARQQYP